MVLSISLQEKKSQIDKRYSKASSHVTNGEREIQYLHHVLSVCLFFLTFSKSSHPLREEQEIWFQLQPLLSICLLLLLYLKREREIQSQLWLVLFICSLLLLRHFKQTCYKHVTKEKFNMSSLCYSFVYFFLLQQCIFYLNRQ